jgi:gluconate kinase
MHLGYQTGRTHVPKSPDGLYRVAFEWCAEHRDVFDLEVTNVWNEMITFRDVIICDNTHLNEGYREKWVGDLRNRGYFITMIYVKTSKDVVIERQKTRWDKTVPVEVIEQQYAKLEEPLPHEYDKLIVIDGTRQYTDEEWTSLLS